MTQEYDKEIQQLIDQLAANVQGHPEAVDQLMRIGTSMQDEYLMGLACLYAAKVHFLDSLHLDEVLEQLNEAADHARKAKDYNTLCSSYVLMGQISDVHCNYPLAAGYYIKAMAAAPKTDSSRYHTGIVMTNIARIFYEVHAYKEALSYHDQAMELMENQGKGPRYIQNMASMHVSRAILALEADHDLARAEEEYEKAEQLRGQEGFDELSEMDQLIVRIRIAAERGEEDEVMRLFHEYMPIQRKVPYTADSIDNVNYLLTHMIQTRQFAACQEIIDYVHQAMHTSIPGVLMEEYSEELQYYKAIGDTEKIHETALRYYDAALSKAEEDDRAALIAVKGSLSEGRLSEENTRLLKEAETDQLTGLPNRFALNNHANEVFDACQRVQKNIGVEIMDVDFFKEYNDTYGHGSGDQCLQKVAEVIQTMTAKEAGMFAARYGGDEIIIVYDSMPTEKMLAIMEEIRQRIADLKIVHARSAAGAYVTVSQGLYADVPKAENRLWDYTAAADGALYYVKNHHKGSWYAMNHASHDPQISNGRKGWERK